MRAWERMCACARETFGRYGFDAIETPAMEQVDVFVHGIGASTDVVRKEMFRVLSGANYATALAAGSDTTLKSSKKLALRPEGTAGVVRAAVEGNFVPTGGAPVKLWYAEPMFRGERVQKGRLRQFHQIGAEVLGAPDPAMDAEIICMLMEFYAALGIPKERLRLRINSMGDPACRPAYRDKVRAFILDHQDELCEECLVRADVNPLRAFDCKNDACRAVMEAAPKAADELCEECASHYAQVKRYLDDAGITYEEDPTLVRGLDYYTRTVFEVEALEGTGSQSALGGGGRYDGLMELEGGKPTPGIGFAVGFERIMLVLEALGIDLGGQEPACVYVACAAPAAREEVFRVCALLRAAGVRTEADYQGRSLKSQLKQANKLRAVATVLIGEDELAGGVVTLRDMTSHEQVQVAPGELAAAVAPLFAAAE
jgi:histidyl-tRNA synthetase